MSEEVVTVERARNFAQRWFPMNAIDDGSPMIGETRLAHITLQLCDEVERLRCRCNAEREIAEIYRRDLADCRGLLETAVDAMSTNGLQCGLTPAWLDEAKRVTGWDDEEEGGGE